MARFALASSMAGCGAGLGLVIGRVGVSDGLVGTSVVVTTAVVAQSALGTAVVACSVLVRAGCRLL